MALLRFDFAQRRYPVRRPTGCHPTEVECQLARRLQPTSRHANSVPDTSSEPAVHHGVALAPQEPDLAVEDPP
jgi:hypothetical protein